MSYGSKITNNSMDSIQPRFCITCGNTCKGSCSGSCSGGCSAKCDNGCSGSCGNNCTDKNYFGGST